MKKKSSKSQKSLKNVTNSIKNVKLTTWITIILLLIPIFLAAYFRAYPASLPAADDWAHTSVEQFYKNQMRSQVNAQYPNLPAQNRDVMVNDQFEQFKVQNAQQLEDQAAQTAENFRNRLKNDNGETYLLAIDPYFYLAFAENKVDHGYPGDTIKDGNYFDSLRVAPLGVIPPKELHSNIMIWTWKVLKIFKPNMSLMGGAFWVPLIIAVLSIIPAFFLVRRKYGDFGGFIGASIIAVNGAYLGRTPAGFSDTDAYNVFFPLLIAWLFLEAFITKDLKKKLGFAAASGLLLGLYSKFWTGWWYIYDIMLGVIVAYLAFLVLRYLFTEKKKLFLKSEEWITGKNVLLLALVFIVSAGILVSAFYGVSKFITAPTGAVSFTQIKNAVTDSLWPNVLTTVAELNEVNFAGVVNNVGGKLLYAFALLGIVVSLLPKKLDVKEWSFLGGSFIWVLYLISDSALSSNFLYKILTALGAPASGTVNSLSYLFLVGLPTLIGTLMLLKHKEDVDLKYAFLVTLWLIGTLYATTKGVRFTLVMVPAIGVAIGSFAGFIYDWLSKWLSEELELSLSIMQVSIAVLLALMILVVPVKAAHTMAKGEVPSMNDAWFNSLTKISNEAAPDAIITSWWDFGHWFKAIGKRGVTFDGGSQGLPTAHWVGKLLLSGNEEESLSILRMIDCGSYTGYDKLKESIGDSVETKALLDEILLLNKEDAKTKLTEAGVNNPDEVLELTHCNPPEAYLITSEDMVGKAGVWGHFGSWSFERAYIASVLKKQPQQQAVAEMKERFGYDDVKAVSTYTELNSYVDERQINNWVAPWPGYLTQRWTGCQRQTVKVNKSLIDPNASSELVDQDLVICPTSLRVGQQNGADIILEAVIIDPENPMQSRMRYGFYQGNQRTGQSDAGQPANLLYAYANATDGTELFNFEGPTSGVGVIFDEENTRVVLTDPLHTDSLFAKLFYLEGKYTDSFEKFSDAYGINGQRIIVWKVNWNN